MIARTVAADKRTARCDHRAAVQTSTPGFCAMRFPPDQPLGHRTPPAVLSPRINDQARSPEIALKARPLAPSAAAAGAPADATSTIVGETSSGCIGTPSTNAPAP